MSFIEKWFNSWTADVVLQVRCRIVVIWTGELGLACIVDLQTWSLCKSTRVMIVITNERMRRRDGRATSSRGRQHPLLADGRRKKRPEISDDDHGKLNFKKKFSNRLLVYIFTRTGCYNRTNKQCKKSPEFSQISSKTFSLVFFSRFCIHLICIISVILHCW